MKPQHLSSDTSMIHECKRMVGERLQQAFQARIVVEDSRSERSESSDSERKIYNTKQVKRLNRRVKMDDPIRTIMFLGSWSHT